MTVRTDTEYHKVWIRLNSHESEKLEKIYQLAQQCQGNDELILYFADTTKKGKAPLSIAIDDRLIDGLNEIAGTENIKLV
jgi:hypothetical protein